MFVCTLPPPWRNPWPGMPGYMNLLIWQSPLTSVAHPAPHAPMVPSVYRVPRTPNAKKSQTCNFSSR